MNLRALRRSILAHEQRSGKRDLVARRNFNHKLHSLRGGGGGDGCVDLGSIIKEEEKKEELLNTIFDHDFKNEQMKQFLQKILKKTQMPYLNKNMIAIVQKSFVINSRKEHGEEVTQDETALKQLRKDETALKQLIEQYFCNQTVKKTMWLNKVLYKSPNQCIDRNMVYDECLQHDSTPTEVDVMQEDDVNKEWEDVKKKVKPGTLAKLRTLMITTTPDAELGNLYAQIEQEVLQDIEQAQ